MIMYAFWGVAAILCAVIGIVFQIKEGKTSIILVFLWLFFLMMCILSPAST